MSLNPFKSRKMKILFFFGPTGWLIFIAILLFFVFVLVAGFSIYQNKVMYFVLKYKAERAIHSAEKNVSFIYREKLTRKYDLTDVNSENGTLDLVRGNGLNLLLIDKIPAEGYIKEMLGLYRKSSQGELDNAPYHMSLESLLATQYNETKTYDGVILKSYIPYINNSIQWKVARGDIPAEAWTLSMLNKNLISDVVNTRGAVASTSNGLRRPGSDFTNVFQVDKDYLDPSDPDSKAYISNMNGYLEGNSRGADIYYLPDSLAYINTQYGYMMKGYGFSSENPLLLGAAYGIYHNGGPAVLQYFSSYGTLVPDSKLGIPNRLKSVKRSTDEYRTNALEVPQDLYDATQKYRKSTLSEISKVGNGYSVAVWLLIENGYYLSGDFMSEVGDGQITQLTKGYNLLYGAHLSTSQVAQKLRGYVRDPWDVYSDYMSKSDFDKVYGIAPDVSYNKGILWRLDDKTSDVYKNKINGSAPRVLYRTNLEVAGFIWDLEFRGATVYANMLKVAGVGIDPTNPSDYLDEVPDNEFVPSSTDFDALLKKMGVTDIDPLAKDMLEEGYRISGFWYYLGGAAKPISSENYKLHRSFRSSSQATSLFGRGEISERVFDMLYATKDGTDPNASEYNRRNSNLKYYGKLIMDCSSLVYAAYNETVAKETGRKLDALNSTAQRSSGMLTTIPSWNDARPGDIFVRNGHVFFFISRNLSGAKQTIGADDTKIGSAVSAQKGGYWILEASDYDTRVGIRARTSISSSKYILRRFNALK